MEALPYSAVDASTCEALAAIANTDLSSGPPVLPTGWSPLSAVTAGGGLQAYLAKGAQPSNPTHVIVVLAVGLQWLPLLNGYDVTKHQLNGLALYLLSGAKGAQVTTFGGLFDLGYQLLYGRLRSVVWPVLPQARGLDLFVVGHGPGAPLAQLAALDLRPGKPGTTSPVTSVTVYSFSTPTLGDAAFQAFFRAEVPGCYAGLVQGGSGTPLDFFPAAPAGGPWVQPSAVETIQATLPAWDDPWWERSSDFYQAALESPSSPALRRGRPAARSPHLFAEAGFDPDLAFTLVQLSALAYQRCQHPNLPLASLPPPWTLVGDVATSDGTTFATLFRTPTQVAVAFRGTVSLEELVTLQGNFFLTAVDFLPASAGQLSTGVSGLYSSLRTQLLAALQAVPGLSALVLFLTGHSLGGALATLCAADLSNPQPSIPAPAAVYTFGAPPFGDADFQSWYASSPLAAITFRVARDFDVMPRASFNSILEQAPAAPTLLTGSTPFDGVTNHPVSGYIELLDPRGAGAR